MILITDSGSTKCDWIVIDKTGKQIHDKIRTKGLNPAILTKKKLNSQEDEEKCCLINKTITKS